MACGGCGSDRTYTLELIDRVQHNATTISLDFKSLEPMTWQEGDSAKVMMPVEGVLEGKKLSFVTLPDEDSIRFTTRIKGDHSVFKDQISQLAVGDIVEVSEPSGNFVLQRGDRPALLLSNGVGIAAVRTLIKSFQQNDEGIHRLTQINVDSSGFLFQEEFEALSRDVQGFKSIYAKHRDEFYRQLDFESQTLMIATGYIPMYYVVGSEAFISDVSSHLMGVGFDEADIVTDSQSIGGSCGSSGGCGCGGCA